MVEWESHQRSDLQIAAQFEYFHQGVLCFFEQQLLCEEILARVPRDAQLGKAEDFHILAFGGHHKFLDFLCVGADIRQLYARYGGSYAQKAVSHGLLGRAWEHALGVS